MRVLLLILMGILAVGGQLYHNSKEFLWPENLQGGLLLLHYWGGWIFMGIFPLYFIDHIRSNRQWLRVFGLRSISGVGLSIAGWGLLLSGMLLFLFDKGFWPGLTQVHHVLTAVMLLSLLGHFLSRENLAPRWWALLMNALKRRKH